MSIVSPYLIDETYFIKLIDDYSLYIYLYLLFNKVDEFVAFKEFEAFLFD